MIFDDVQKEEYKWYSYSERATLHQLSTKYCALYFEHFNVANTSDVRGKCCRGQRRRGGEAGGGSLPVSAQSVSGL